MDSKVSQYLKAFKKLKVDRSNGIAPHKPVLLLSIIEHIDQGLITGPKIHVTPELVGTFKSMWNGLVVTQHHMIFALPFFHMRSEPFWKLHPKPGFEKFLKHSKTVRQLSTLMASVEYAEMDAVLFELLLQKGYRLQFREWLLHHFFGENSTIQLNLTSVFERISYELNQFDATSYKEKMQDMQAKMDSADFEEEVFVRSGVFKREIPRIYNDTCAISGLRVDALISISMVDACHIVPFSESYDDTLTNGIALCPNLHRAFDRGLISIARNGTVLVHSSLHEPYKIPYSINQYSGKSIDIPPEIDPIRFMENMKHHRNKHGFSH